MSQRNGDRSRFQINRKRKLQHRQRVRTLLSALAVRAQDPAADGQLAAESKPRRK